MTTTVTLEAPNPPRKTPLRISRLTSKANLADLIHEVTQARRVAPAARDAIDATVQAFAKALIQYTEVAYRLDREDRKRRGVQAEPDLRAKYVERGHELLLARLADRTKPRPAGL